MPSDPCRGCKSKGNCCTQGLMNRLAIFNWIDDLSGVECADYEPDYYHGIEGVFA